MRRLVAVVNPVAGLVLLLSLAVAPACGGRGGAAASNRLEGTYHGGANTLDFKGDKVTVTIGGESKTLDYKVEGDKVTIVNPQEGDLVMTRNSDGSLNTAWGAFQKTAQ